MLTHIYKTFLENNKKGVKRKIDGTEVGSANGRGTDCLGMMNPGQGTPHGSQRCYTEKDKRTVLENPRYFTGSRRVNSKTLPYLERAVYNC